MRNLFERHRSVVLHWIMEVVVVVIGVLLALSVQQWAENRASQQRGRDAEARIRRELMAVASDVVERIAVHGCLKQRLAELGEGVSRGSPDWRPTAIPDPLKDRLAFPLVYRTPSRPFGNDAFRGAISSGDLASLSPERLRAISTAYGMLDRIAQRNQEEGPLAAGLGSLQFPGARTPAERSRILAVITSLDQINHLQRLVAEQHLDRVRAIGLVATVAEVAEIRRGGHVARWIAEGQAKYGQCFDANAMAVLDPRLRSIVTR